MNGGDSVKPEEGSDWNRAAVSLKGGEYDDVEEELGRPDWGNLS
jgi:hypothetical protein